MPDSAGLWDNVENNAPVRVYGERNDRDSGRTFVTSGIR